MTTILEGIVGSVAQGLATATSDIDRLAVHAVPLDSILGLDGPQVVSQAIVHQDPDRTSHELGKFAALALRCNPTVTELLWLDEHEVCTEEGRLLLDLRTACLSANAVRGAYGGYARSQMDRLLRRNDGTFSADLRNRTAKHARHCRRLLIQGSELLESGTLTVSVGERRDEVFAAGEWAVADPRGFAEAFLRDLDVFDALESILPAHPQQALVERGVVAIRRRLAGI